MECETLLRLAVAAVGALLAFQVYIVITLRNRRRARESWRVLCALEHGGMDAVSVARATGISRNRCVDILIDREKEGRVRYNLKWRGSYYTQPVVTYCLTAETERELAALPRVPAFPGER